MLNHESHSPRPARRRLRTRTGCLTCETRALRRTSYEPSVQASETDERHCQAARGGRNATRNGRCALGVVEMSYNVVGYQTRNRGRSERTSSISNSPRTLLPTLLLHFLVFEDVRLPGHPVRAAPQILTLAPHQRTANCDCCPPPPRWRRTALRA